MSPRRARFLRLIDYCTTYLKASGPDLDPISRVIKKMKKRTKQQKQGNNRRRRRDACFECLCVYLLQGLRFVVWVVGFGSWGLGFGVWGSQVQGLGCRVQGSGLRVQGLGFWV